MFGIGADVDEATWRSVFRQLVALGFARVDHAGYGALKLTEAARPVLKGERSVEMRRTVARVRTPRSRPLREASLRGVDATLLESLRAWRLAEARSQAVPAYVILHDRTLAEIAQVRPRDLRALGAIGGIGVRKLERYGPALLAVVAPPGA